MLKPQFKVIPHASDIGIRVQASSIKALFEYAAFGMFSLVSPPARIKNPVKKTINLDATDMENLLVVWLSELLYDFHTEKILFSEFRIKAITETHVYAEVTGENLELTPKKLKREIKAVTYHGMKITHANKKWTAEIIFDL